MQIQSEGGRFRHYLRTIGQAFSIWFLLLTSGIQAADPPRLLEVDFPQTRIVGMPVHWGRSDAAVIEPDGQFHLFDLSQVVRHRVLEEPFQPQSLPATRSLLQAELGKKYETFIAGPYVIATPRGQSARWRQRFTELLSGYTRYFNVRGWPLIKPDFPLVVIVYPDRKEFLSYVSRQSEQLPSQAVGCYLPRSNRCVLYQIPSAGGTNWRETEATIVHEAVHQLAYNTGVHERLFENPFWFVEGLATMFEQPAVYELGVARSTIETRMNASQLRELQVHLQEPSEFSKRLRSLVAADDMFQYDAQSAYAISWAMTFYLAERMPGQYRDYFLLQNKRRFGSYKTASRLNDFRRAFQTDFDMLAASMVRLYQQ